MAAAAFSRAGGGAPSHGGSWRQRLGAIVPGGRAAKSLLTAARIRRVTGRAVTEIEAGQEGSVAFWEQGAASMYTNEAIVKRAEARHDPGVLDILHTWWETARRSLLLGVGSPMEKRGYTMMMRKIYRVVIEEYDEEDATACAEEDWEKDAKGETTLSREMFGDALFELADTWVRSMRCYCL